MSAPRRAARARAGAAAGGRPARRQLARLAPALGPEHYSTYGILRPTQTHSRAASCAEVECDAYRLGWATPVDESTDLGQRQAGWIRHHAGRRYVERRDGALTRFEFHPEQPCFAEHRVPLDRPSLFLVKGGDWRGNPRRIPVRRHASGRDWVDDFGEHQDRLAELHRRG